MFGEKVTPLLWQRANAWNLNLFNSLLWQIYDLNYVINTNLPVILFHQYSTTVSLETYPLYSFYFGLDRLYNSQHEHLTYLGYYISFLPFHDISMDVFKQKEIIHVEDLFEQYFPEFLDSQYSIKST